MLREIEAVTPMTIAAERCLTPLLGRDEELAVLESCFARLASGAPQVVAVVGGAGSGKSRLLYEFTQRLATRPAVVLEGHCSSLSQTVPYHPFTTMLGQHICTAEPRPPRTSTMRAISPTMSAVALLVGMSGCFFPVHDRRGPDWRTDRHGHTYRDSHFVVMDGVRPIHSPRIL